MQRKIRDDKYKLGLLKPGELLLTELFM
jgi:hypothetical protein